MSVIETEGLVKHFGKVHALDGVDLSVAEGEVYGFIGPNGAGKSTTIRVLLGILKATAGHATIFGQDVWKEAVDIHKRIAYVPGDVNLWSNLSGGEVIDLFLRLRKGRERAYRNELIERFDFDPTKKCGTYSKGNRQKVALVAAFSADADLYVLDEPTSGLDPLMEMVFRECVAEVKKRGACVFLSSHILSEVEHLCDRISIIRQGKIIDSGTLDEMRHLTRNKVSVHSMVSLAGLERVAGVFDIHAEAPTEGHGAAGFATSFSLENSQTAEVLAFLADKQVTHLTSVPPALEELFMSHYAGGENATTTGDAHATAAVASTTAPSGALSTTAPSGEFSEGASEAPSGTPSETTSTAASAGNKEQ
ncbi:MAG: ABC transporter ATP-binding protein [Coriobacteriaceae bacterium]|jgi:ABC-2 type transport system ATP-binding protein|nr:ABC transporter ATP-binding protein [Coriobacteriaceae bacterium]